jgi:hypothetical protein
MILSGSVCFGHSIILNGFVVDEGRVHLGHSGCNIEREGRAILGVQDAVYKAFTVDDLLKEWVLGAYWVTAKDS